MKRLLKATFVCIFVFAVAGLVTAQTPTNVPSFPRFNPGPCDFSDQFYADNGLDASSTSELNAEPDGRFGSFRQFGPPATGFQANWVADNRNCSDKDPTRRDFRILATTGGNSDDGNSPFSCADQGGAFATPACAGQPGIPETVEFISILAFLHNQNVFESSYSRTVGFINGGLNGVQQNPGEIVSLTPGTDAAGNNTGLNPRGISMQFMVGNFEAYAAQNQFIKGKFAAGPCSVGMNANQGRTVPNPCFPVNDTIVNGHTLSNVATPNLRQDWRFATNRNAMDGSDNNCISTDLTVCPNGVNDSPFGYFCDDLLGMWILTYFWFVQPPNTTDPVCAPIFKAIGNANGFSPDGFPIILTAHELNDELEANNCGAEGQEDPGGSDGGAVWLVCPALPDPRNGAITTDAFLDVVRNRSGNAIDTFLQNQFSCLQKGGKFCFETAPGQ
ncbi:MAG: hypothetical protein LAP21_22755 [Acidobacteriia bacterium]|nr:hypothetical protein [Terriglobia bacterium]